MAVQFHCEVAIKQIDHHFSNSSNLKRDLLIFSVHWLVEDDFTWRESFNEIDGFLEWIVGNSVQNHQTRNYVLRKYALE